MTYKKIAIVSTLLLISIRMYGKSKTTFSPLAGNGVRGCDAFGCGNFGASRGGRAHNGIDIIAAENQVIKAPFSCKILRYGYPYANDLSYRLVEIQGLNEFKDYTAKIMYIKKLHDLGAIIKTGDPLCSADNIAKKYGSSMTNHVHFELFKAGKRIDPTPFF